MNEIPLPGLDGSNPLGFLAALGVLRVLDEHAIREHGTRPRMTWRESGAWHPLVAGPASLDTVLDSLDADRTGRAAGHELGLAYTKDGARCPVDDGEAIRDLKAPVPVLRQWLQETAERGDRRAADLAVAYTAEGVVDRKGVNSKPTALHFTAGQQTFLDMVAKLQAGVRRADLEEAVRGPWVGASTLPSLSWDPTVTRMYALRASDPSGEKRGSVAGAYWLAFIGMSALPTARRRDALETTAVQGTWSDGEFTWPLWGCPATWAVARTLIGQFSGFRSDLTARRERGVVAAFTAGIGRVGQGYGTFRPSSPA